ncbi:hypothetical protein LF65_04922 [Clostridium beijerinckii]|uniref:Uncharacterized protein n=1 Tax=Clostridium beijerinckii TaxID=1520 RepID=A0A0B5QKJ4_CLOBE|nr:hypothetical protein [Clostridium beijerinckii]AJH01451.1 hypothetical protein LF65_04922 [Clostridium beijerinckii]
MVRYRISKYNPVYRDEDGNYTREEWTAISDVEKTINGDKLSLEEYLDIESKYIIILDNILNELSIENLYVMELEEQKNSINDEYVFTGFTKEIVRKISSLEEGQQLNRKEINYIIKAMLREIVWCGLYSKTIHVIIKSGFDFYINIICPKLSESVIENARRIGIYIEEIK